MRLLTWFDAAGVGSDVERVDCPCERRRVRRNQRSLRRAVRYRRSVRERRDAANRPSSSDATLRPISPPLAPVFVFFLNKRSPNQLKERIRCLGMGGGGKGFNPVIELLPLPSFLSARHFHRICDTLKLSLWLGESECAYQTGDPLFLSPHQIRQPERVNTEIVFNVFSFPSCFFFCFFVFVLFFVLPQVTLGLPELSLYYSPGKFRMSTTRRYRSRCYVHADPRLHFWLLSLFFFPPGFSVELYAINWLGDPHLSAFIRNFLLQDESIKKKKIASVRANEDERLYCF